MSEPIVIGRTGTAMGRAEPLYVFETTDAPLAAAIGMVPWLQRIAKNLAAATTFGEMQIVKQDAEDALREIAAYAEHLRGEPA